MKQILQDDILEKKLSEDGYVVIPFLTEDEVRSLIHFYYQYHNMQLNGMYATAHVSDIELRIKMNNYIEDKFSRAIKSVFINATALGGSYIAKGKGEIGTLNPHQDWNIVDEDKYRSFNIWVPLVDLNENNGAICILPQSHLWGKTYRSANISSSFQDTESELWVKMSRIFLKAGEALIYDHRLIHASGENTTDEIRLAAVFGIIPEEAEMFYYHKKDESTIEIYESDPKFFLYGNIFEGPKGLKKTSEFEFKSSPIAPKHTEPYPNPRGGIFSRIRSYFTAH